MKNGRCVTDDRARNLLKGTTRGARRLSRTNSNDDEDSKRYIVAIEEGNYDQLPGAFYARAFIKTYAEALGLDVDEVFTTYKRDLPEPETQPVVELSRRATYSKSSAPKKSVAKRWIPNIIIIVLIFAIGAALYYGLQMFLDGNEEAKTSAPKQNDVTIDQGDAPSKETDAPAKTEEKPKEEPAKQEETKEKPKKKRLLRSRHLVKMSPMKSQRKIR